MKKYLSLATAATLALASCTSDDIAFNNAQDVIEAQQTNAIQFGTYMGNQAMTRAGQTGSINTDVLKASTAGFGVFAYYTGAQDYQTFTAYTDPASLGASGQTSKMANFMFNQQVTYSTARETGGYVTQWTYSPMKYWPNEVQNGAVDDQDNDASNDPATSTNTNGGNVSFFAYAPYVSETSLSGETTGITAINGKTNGTSNAEKTDPIITYVVPQDADKIVDLLWGTYSNTSPNVLGAGNAGVAFDANGTAYQKAILPHFTTANKSTNDGYRLNADLTKQKTNGTVGFAFKHALAKVGGSDTYSSLSGTTHGLMIIADIDDQKGAEAGGALSSATRITVTDIQIAARALYDVDSDNTIEDNEYLKKMQGNLNLATGQWGVLTSGNTDNQNNAATTNHNITSPASSGVTSSAELNDNIAEPASVGTTWNNVPTGVTTTAQNVYKSEANPLVFIPGTVPELTITITYTVRSSDSKLAAGAGKDDEGKWTYVKQVITKRVRFANPVELNKQYSLLIHLGLTGVKFTATVSDWEVAGDTNGNGSIDTGEELIVEDAYLPINVSGVKYTFTSYDAETSGTQYATGVANLTGVTKVFNISGIDKTFNEVKIQYNTVESFNGATFYIASDATTDGTTRTQLYDADGNAQPLWVAVAPWAAKTYNFTSWSTSSGGTQYSAGTAQTTGNSKTISGQVYQQIRVLTNPGYTSWEGKTYYILGSATTGDTRYELYDENGTTTNVWVKIGTEVN